MLKYPVIFQFLLFSVCWFGCNVQANSLPSYIKRCDVGDPHLDKCLSDNTADAIRAFHKGEPDLGIPPLEPFEIKEMVVPAGPGAVKVEQNYKDILLHHLTNFTITKYNFDLEHDQLKCETYSPKLVLLGNYKMDGKILIITINGEGRFNITLEGAKLTHHLTMTRYEKDGNTHWKMLGYKVKIDPRRVYFDFSNLMGADDKISKDINGLLNDSWETLYEDVRDGYEKAFGDIFESLAESVFSRVPYNEIFIVP